MPEESSLEEMKKRYPGKFIPEPEAFKRIHRGDHIFISTGCGEPQHLVRSLIEYVNANPKAFFDAEVLQVWTLGVSPYGNEKFKSNFRLNAFFVGNSSRGAVNSGLADYSPVFMSQIPGLFNRKVVPVDVALIQISPPDGHGYMSLGVSVDITKAACENAKVIIAQVNRNMPRVHGDTFIHIDKVDALIPHDEPVLEYESKVSDEIAGRVGKYVAHIVEDGDTIQVGYGSIPNAIMANLKGKKHLGIHTELLTDGMVELMRLGAVDNSKKTVDKGKTVASFCMGKKGTYDFINDNPSISFKRIDYTNNPLIIAQQKNMTAINTALEVDLTGQSTAESLGNVFYSGIGGQADFMRGAILAPGGKTILAIESTARGGEVSRIVPFLSEGSGVTLTRGDIHYVVTEYGVAYLHGKNVRERAMDLIAIAHPKFQPWLIEEAKKLGLIYKDQAFIPGKRGKYPEELEFFRTTRAGISILLRPVRISDEPLLKDLFCSLSDQSIYRRFMSVRKDMPHERLQEFVVIDYTKEMVMLATIEKEGVETALAVGQYGIDEDTHTAEVALVVRDDYQGKGVGTELLTCLTLLAKKAGLLGFTAEVLAENKPMLDLFGRMGFDMDRKSESGGFRLRLGFRGI